MQNKVQNIFKSLPFKQILQAKGIEIVSISVSKQTETTQRWKLLLKTDSSDILLSTKIEFSRRGLQNDIKFEAVSSYILRMYQLRPIMVNHYSANAALKQKVYALANRSQTQARDVFDIYLLITTQALDVIFDEDLIAVANDALDKILTLTFQDFNGQVLAYLTPEYQNQYNSEAVWNDIVIKVTNVLEAKINEAT